MFVRWTESENYTAVFNILRFGSINFSIFGYCMPRVFDCRLQPCMSRHTVPRSTYLNNSKHPTSSPTSSRQPYLLRWSPWPQSSTVCIPLPDILVQRSALGSDCFSSFFVTRYMITTMSVSWFLASQLRSGASNSLLPSQPEVDKDDKGQWSTSSRCTCGA